MSKTEINISFHRFCCVCVYISLYVCVYISTWEQGHVPATVCVWRSEEPSQVPLLVFYLFQTELFVAVSLCSTDWLSLASGEPPVSASHLPIGAQGLQILKILCPAFVCLFFVF